MDVPLVDLRPQHQEIADELRAAWDAILERSAYVLGEEVAAFEREYAEFAGVEHVVGVANGTDALELALRALDIGAGDEVVVPANTFIASALAVARAGATPVLVDVDPATQLIDVEQALNAVTERTRAIMPV